MSFLIGIQPSLKEPIPQCPKHPQLTSFLERESSLVPCNDLNSSAATLEPYIETADKMPNPSLSVVGTGTITGTPTNLSLETTDSVSVNMCKQSIKSIHLDYFLWLVNRLIKGVRVGLCCPWIHSAQKFDCEFEFLCYHNNITPILPCLATTYDATLTTMINFQDALKQKVILTVGYGPTREFIELRRRYSF